MFNSVDLYLGSCLILCGFALSLLNLKRLIKQRKASFSPVLISENLLLMCIGIAFIGRSINHLNPTNVRMDEIEQRTASFVKDDEAIMDCDFKSVLLTYGPLIVSIVNSFLNLVIDNYLHYRMLADMKKQNEDSTGQEIHEELTSVSITRVNNISSFVTEYMIYIIIGIQWLIPVVFATALYPVNIKEFITINVHNHDESCLNILDIAKENCSLTNYTDYSLELRNYIPAQNYLVAHDDEPVSANKSKQIESVIKNVFQILHNFKNNSIQDLEVTSAYLYRKPKLNDKCMKVCYLENKNLLLYMFVLAVASFFVPVTISTIILTKIHLMDVKKPNVRTYINRELVYNMLFWSPVMFDTFLSLLMCSYSMNGMRTSIFNVIANIYQVVKTFMNTKHLNDNFVLPV